MNSKNTFSYRTPLVAASDNNVILKVDSLDSGFILDNRF